MSKMPAFQFYPGDWRRDPGVNALNRHDRSVWFDMMCIMHESEERGVLLLAGNPMPDVALAQLLNLDNQTLNQTLTTLLTYGVASRRETDGAIICRRMVRDEKLCQIRRQSGKLGGNPVLVNQTTNQTPTTGDNQNPTPSSSSSSSVQNQSLVETDEEQTPKLALEPEPDKSSTPEQRDAVAQVFDYYLDKVGKKITLYALTSKRMQKGLVCLRECLRREDGNVQKAFAKMCDAVDGLTFNDWNMGRDRNSVRQYTDWEEHVFKNVETMEKRWDDFYRKAKAS